MDRRTFVVSALATSAVAVAGPAISQTYPAKPVRLVVPYAPGGAGDTFSRILAEALEKRLGQPIVIENRGGAGGTLAAESVASSSPDGYTLLTAEISANALAGALFPNLSYDPATAFAPINFSVRCPLVLVVPADLPAQNVGELINLAKEKPDQVSNYASAGVGNIAHLAGELFQAQAGLKLTHLPFRGGAPAVAALVGGQAQSYFSSIASAKPMIEAGRIRPLAVTSEQRSAQLADVPTISESGLPNFDVYVWAGVVGPAGLPGPVTDRLSRDLNAVLADPAVKAKLGTFGFEVVGGTPAEFASFINSEINRWTPIIKSAGIKAE